jgi:hypothetical protein
MKSIIINKKLIVEIKQIKTWGYFGELEKDSKDLLDSEAKGKFSPLWVA